MIQPIRPRSGEGGVATPFDIELNAVIVAVRDEQPLVLTLPAEGRDEVPALPSGPLDPPAHHTLGQGLRSWVRALTGLNLGYVEQLYTFGDRGPGLTGEEDGRRLISISYLALVRAEDLAEASGAVWEPWYRFFPWEDWRAGRPRPIAEEMLPALARWAASRDAETTARRTVRVAANFGTTRGAWDAARALERYELLYEAGLVAERWRGAAAPAELAQAGGHPGFGDAMAYDHRRILATAIARLRGKLDYRPVVFELLPPVFTLLHLQRTVEALNGQRLHKQNFRRLVEKGGLVEPTGARETQTGGRPALQYRYRERVLSERVPPAAASTAPPEFKPASSGP